MLVETQAREKITLTKIFCGEMIKGYFKSEKALLLKNDLYLDFQFSMSFAS